MYYKWKRLVTLRAPERDQWLLEFDDLTVSECPSLQRLDKDGVKRDFLAKVRAAARTYTSV